MRVPLVRVLAACFALLGVASADVTIDGVVSDVFSGQPLPGAAVEAEDVGRPPETVSLARATADEKGGYHLALPSGADRPRVRLFVQAKGHMPDSVIIRVRAADSGPHRLDFALPRGAAVKGRVVDSSGRPVSGARLRIRSSGPKEASTDDFLRPDPAEARAIAMEDGAFGPVWAQTGPMTIWVDSDGRGGGKADVAVTGAETVEVHLWAPREGRLRVVDAATRQPCVGVPVDVLDTDLGWAETAITDEQGGVHLRDLPPGELNAGTLIPRYHEAGDTWATGDEPLVLALETLSPPGTGSASISGVIVYAGDGTPVPGVEVSVGDVVATTDEEGIFHVEGLEPGAIRVSAARGGVYAGEVPSTVTIELVEGEKHEDVRIEIDYRPGRIYGKVLGPDGAPAAGARICLAFADYEREGVCAGYLRMQDGIACLDGSFDLPVGDEHAYVHVVASHPALAGGHSRAYVVAELARRCPIEVRLVPSTPISGRLVGIDGKPIVGVSVFAEDAYAQPERENEQPWSPLPVECVTDMDGFYGLVLPPGPTALRVNAPGYADGVQRCMQIDPGDPPRSLDLTLRRSH